MRDKKVSVIGLGYIGLPTAAVVASSGFNVIGVDVNQHAVDTVNKGQIHIVEPDLDVVVSSVVKSKKLIAKTEPEEADIFLIAVPTPFKEEKKPDLKYVEAATRSVAKVLKEGDLVILESTSPVGTTDKISKWLAEERVDLRVASRESDNCDVYLAHCPERVLPGHILRELVNNDRVIGGINARSSQMSKEFYESFVDGDCIVTDARTAEMAKLTENTFRDVNIALANELSLICDKMDINVWELISLANRHPRVNVLQPGPGVGGHCISVDPWFIVDSAPEIATLTRTSREVNDAKPQFIVDKVLQRISTVMLPTIACFGATFKPDIDDLRESPALEIIENLSAQNRNNILVVEPNIDKLPAKFSSCSNIRLVDIETALAESDIGVMLVAHKEFRKSSDKIASLQMIYAVNIGG